MPGTSTGTSIRATILVVEDDDVVRESLCTLFREEGYETVAACNGSEALLALQPRHERPMIVLLDLLMPTCNGEQVLRLALHDAALRDHHAYIVHTANVEAVTPAVADLLEDLDAPLLPKPFDIDTLLTLVEDAGRRLDGPVNTGPEVGVARA